MGRHTLIKMCDALGAVAVTEYKPVTEPQLPAYGIGVQIHPWTFADYPVLIVSSLRAETADWNEIIHGTLLRALARSIHHGSSRHRRKRVPREAYLVYARDLREKRDGLDVLSARVAPVAHVLLVSLTILCARAADRRLPQTCS